MAEATQRHEVDHALNASHGGNVDIAATGAGARERWYLRPNDIERLSGIKASTVRDATYRGELPARKFRGRGWLITEADARRWIEDQTTPSDALGTNIA